jgi:hypothetical protein
MSDSNKPNIGKNGNVTEDQNVSTSRRKFTKAALMASPVLMTVASKPVWANPMRKCSVSVLMSANHSVDTDWSGCRTCSPGYWHHQNACWNSAGMQHDRNTTFATRFSIDPTGFEVDEVTALNMTLQQLVSQTGGGSNKFLMFCRAATASVLNARALGHLFPHVTIPSESQVLAVIAQVFDLNVPYAQRKTNATIKEGELNDYYEEGYVDCILPNSPHNDCPSSNFYTP